MLVSSLIGGVHRKAGRTASCILAMVLGTVSLPGDKKMCIRDRVNVLNGNIRGLVVALNAIAEKKEA